MPRWAAELASAIAYLETLGLAHGDLRLPNVLLDDEDHIKLTDFDCVGRFGTPFDLFMAPWSELLPTEEDESPELDTSSFNFTSHERSILFTTNKTAPNIDLTVTGSSETCRTSSNLALNVTDLLHVSSFDFRGYPSCAVLGSAPTQSNPCAVKIDAAAASSVSAAVTLEACRATATGSMPCASLKPKSAAHTTQTSTVRVLLVCFGVMICMLL